MILGRFKISGKSMEPLFKAGDRLLASSVVYKFAKPKKGDVVIAKDPRDDRLLLKRIEKAERGKFFVHGDNEEFSTDSRVFGALKAENIIAKVIFRN